MKSRKEIAVDVISILTGAMFLYHAVTILAGYERFRSQLEESPLFTAIEDLVAWSIPLLETAIAVLLMITHTRLVGLYASFSLMVIFSCYICTVAQLNGYVPGSILNTPDWTEHLFFNLVFVVLAAFGIMWHGRPTHTRDDHTMLSPGA